MRVEAIPPSLAEHIASLAHPLRDAARIHTAINEFITAFEPTRSEPTRAPAPIAAPTPRRRPAVTTGSGSAVKLTKAQGAVLAVLAQFPDGRTKRQLAMQTGYSANGGGFNNALSSLRNHEPPLITPGEPIRPTDDGLSAIDGAYEPLPTGRALFEHWLGQVNKAGRLILEQLERGPLSKDDLADRTGYAASGGGFNNALSRLRTLQLIEGSGELALTSELAEAIR